MTEYSLLPDEFNFLFWQGDTLTIQFTVVDDADAPIDLSTYASIRGQVRDNVGAIIADLIIVETALPSGIFQTFLEQEDSAQLQPGIEYQYDIQLEGTKMIESTQHKTISTIVQGFYQVSKESTLESGVAVYQQVAPGEQPSYTVKRRGL